MRHNRHRSQPQPPQLPILPSAISTVPASTASAKPPPLYPSPCHDHSNLPYPPRCGNISGQVEPSLWSASHRGDYMVEECAHYNQFPDCGIIPHESAYWDKARHAGMDAFSQMACLPLIVPIRMAGNLTYGLSLMALRACAVACDQCSWSTMLWLALLLFIVQ